VISPRAASTAAKCGSSASAATGSPPTRQRSSKCTSCGFWYRPDAVAGVRAIDSSIAQVEPLPLVPAT
jgi:hypothetical protein